MPRWAVWAVAAALVLPSGGCLGPEKITRRMDDWTNQTYVENPWMIGNTLSASLLHGVFLVTNLIDTPINAYYFWARDAWPFGTGTGTKFDHKPVLPPVR